MVEVDTTEIELDASITTNQGKLNIALSFFDVIRDYDDSTEKEVILFKQYLPAATQYCTRLSDWSFMAKNTTLSTVTNRTNVEEDDIEDYIGKPETFIGEKYTDSTTGTIYYPVYTTYKGFKYAFTLPTDFIKILYVNGSKMRGYAIQGKTIYCNCEAPVIVYIGNTLTNAPDDFHYLIAYNTAMLLSQFLDPEGTALNRASNLFTLTLQALKANDDEEFNIENPPQDYYISIDSPYWRGKL